ncbi:hypothetical protein LTR08_002985 [Meristemomyces frigidus]|nr:hypothetical protein LTR08_002985 [Meristemomyces frigidus]
MTPPCLRCKAFGDPGIYRHNILKCHDPDHHAIEEYWPDFPDVGPPFQAPADIQECKDFFKTLKKGGEYDGRPLTKNMLEALHQRAMTKVARAPPAPAKTKVAAKVSQATSAKGKDASTFTSAAADSGNGKANEMTPPPWRETFIHSDGLPGACAAKGSDEAIWAQGRVNATADDEKTDAKRVGTGGQSARIATNYVVVGKVPKVVWVYGVKFVVGVKVVGKGEEGVGDEGVGVGAQLLEVQEAAADAEFPTVGDVAASLPETASPVTQSGDQTISMHDMMDGEEKFGQPVVETEENTPAVATTRPAREVKRRTEKRHVFDALRTAVPFSGRDDWATDFDTVWSLSPLSFTSHQSGPPVEGQIFIIHDVPYHKASGHEAQLDRVEFTFLRTLRFDNGTATESLLNSGHTTDKGASVHVTALNGLISKHATEMQPGTITQVGPNKFFLCNGFTNLPPPASRNSLAAPLNAHRGYYSSVRPGNERVLLNIGTKAGAFINPMLVSSFLTRINAANYDEYGTRPSLLIGKTVRICYDRAQIKADFDPNLERNRHKTIASFGQVPSKQMFYLASEGREISVKEYFVKLGVSLAPSDAHSCANVGLAPRSEKDEWGRDTGVESEQTKGKQLWIPASYLEIDPNQPFNRRLCPDHMEAMLAAAQHRPAETQKLISDEGLRTLGLTQANVNPQQANARLAVLGLNIDPRLIEIPARFLPGPHIVFALNKSVQAKAASWALGGGGGRDPFWTARFFRLPSPTDIYPLKKGVHVLDFCTKGKGGQSANLGNVLTNRLVAHGLRFDSQASNGWSLEVSARSQQPQQPDRLRLAMSDYTDAELVKMLVNLRNVWAKPDLFLVLLDKKDSGNYATIKRVLDQYLGLHSVCLTHAKFHRKEPSPQLFSNLALKVNMKLGGQSHQVSEQDGRSMKSMFASIATDTIVLGADVSHAPSQMSFCPSVASVVGSNDTAFANFPGSMRLQASGQEIVEELADMVKERVGAYITSNKRVPSRMIFYRDGVGEDQFQLVQSKEIVAVEAGFAAARAELAGKKDNKEGKILDHGKPLVLTFIVVGKRHNTRFFCREIEQSSKLFRNGELKGKGSIAIREAHDGSTIYNPSYNGNVKPGLIVDTVITRPPVDQIYDFFLQSHEALKGTAKSGHYVVLKPGNLTVNQIQTLTHAFCYNYARATKGVSYAGPAYYADRLCERGTHYLKAFTANKSSPPWQMTPAEKQGGKDGGKTYAKRVADNVSNRPEWNLRIVDRRKNPWHPNFDNCMFWL